MNLIEQYIQPFFDNADSIIQAFLNIFITFFSIGYVTVRALLTILQ